MQFQQAVADMEHPPEVRAQPTGDVLHVDLGHQIAVQRGPDVAQGGGQNRGALVGGFVIPEFLGDVLVDEVRQRGQVAPALRAEPPPDHHGLQVDIEAGGHQCLLGIGHDHHLVDEFVIGAAPLVHLLAEVALLGVGQRLNSQHLEVLRFAAAGVPGIRAVGLCGRQFVVIEGHYVGVAEAVGLVGKRVADVIDTQGEFGVVAGVENSLQLGELTLSRIGPVRFDRRELGEHVGAGRRSGVGGLTGGSQSCQPSGGVLEAGPRVGTHLADAVIHGRGHQQAPSERIRLAGPIPEPGCNERSWSPGSRGKPGRRHRAARCPAQESPRPPSRRHRGPDPSRCR